MTQEEIFKKITDVIVAKLEVKAEDVKMESEFGNDLGADSLDRVTLSKSKSSIPMPKSSSRFPTWSPSWKKRRSNSLHMPRVLRPQVGRSGFPGPRAGAANSPVKPGVFLYLSLGSKGVYIGRKEHAA